MAELKTKKNDASVSEFIDSIEDEEKRKDCREVSRMMGRVTGRKPKMWGDSIVGFGEYHYKYASGREGDWFRMGFSPRKQNLTLYIMDGFDRYDELLKSLGKHKTGKSCLYIKRLEDVDRDILDELLKESHEYFQEKHGEG